MGSSVNWWHGVPVNRYHNKSCTGLVITCFTLSYYALSRNCANSLWNKLSTVFLLRRFIFSFTIRDSTKKTIYQDHRWICYEIITLISKCNYSFFNDYQNSLTFLLARSFFKIIPGHKKNERIMMGSK